ncbi:MAG: 2'-5' RNA ligase family protein [Planctomycetota bacterium]
MDIRHQASLYLSDAGAIETLRQRFNPRQAELIPAHVTLCREDEVGDWDLLRARASDLCPFELRLEFGAAIRDRDLVYLPVVSGEAEFRELRADLLGTRPRDHDPHITLIHPRNGRCTDRDFREISRLAEPFGHVFRSIRVIEQRDGGKWRTLFQTPG